MLRTPKHSAHSALLDVKEPPERAPEAGRLKRSSTAAVGGTAAGAADRRASGLPSRVRRSRTHRHTCRVLATPHELTCGTHDGR